MEARANRRQGLDDAIIRHELTAEQYEVMRCCGTEPPFQNEYWDNQEPGIYVDRISGEPLFSSLTKYNSGTGWPSFFAPLDDTAVILLEDNSHKMQRTEVRSSSSDSHLGHVFPDGPEPTGLRYCINSAALKFIPLQEMEQQGYGDYLVLFEGQV